MLKNTSRCINLWYNVFMKNLYKKSGVNLSEAREFERKISSIGDNIGRFAGINGNIVSTCDGIGTKIIPLYKRGLYKTIAQDLAAANLNDLAASGAKALGFSDYIAVYKLDSERISQIILELANILKEHSCPLLGGETAEMPDLITEGNIDISGFVIGEGNGVNSINLKEGDLIIGLKSSGVHANGFSLVRKFYTDGMLSEKEFEETLKPSYIYYSKVLKLWEKGLIKAAANITGGGIYSNLKRVVPEFELDPNSFEKIPVLEKLKELTGEEEFYQVFNPGIGFCLAAESFSEDIKQICGEFSPRIIGRVL